MKRLVFVATVMLASLGFTLKGQVSLGVVDSSSTVPTNMYYNNSYVYKTVIKNYSLFAYSGPVKFFYSVDSLSNGNLVLLRVDSINMNIAANDTASFSLSILTDSSSANKAFRSGINTVVIWPKSTSTPFTTHDSLKAVVNVLGYSGIENYTEPRPLVFPNPMQNLLFIINRDPNFVIEQVRIWDIAGRLIHTELFKGNIDVSKLSAGSYTLEFSAKNGRVSRYKVIKE